MRWLREVVAWVQIYVGGPPWRIANQWLARDRTAGKLSPCVVLSRGVDLQGRRWKFAALLRGRGVGTQFVWEDGEGGGSGGAIPDPVWAGTLGQLVDGAVARVVARVEVRLDDGSEVQPPLLGYGFPARFFIAEVPAGRHATRVAAFGEGGELLGEVPLRRQPPDDSSDRSRLPSGPPPMSTAVELEMPTANEAQ